MGADARLSDVRIVYGSGKMAGGQWVLWAALLLPAGCASPGRPLPPSLYLPAPVNDLRAERVGDAVRLQWTEPATATDGVALRGAVTTELCRDVVADGAAASTGAACTVVRRWGAAQGATAAEDALPAALTAEPAGALVYRVRVLNRSGGSAGMSNAAYAASGRAPEALSRVEATADARGVRLRWQPAGAGPEAAIEMVRTETGGQVAKATPTQGAGRRVKMAGYGSGTKAEGGGQELRVDAAAVDPGGAVDATALRDRRYRYVLTRVRTVEVGGRSLELRGPASAAVVVTAHDLAAPAVPEGLVAAADGLGVALSWEPDMEADLLGYRVYRATVPAAAGGAATWVRVNEQPVGTPGYRDEVPGGGRYRYRVTAVDASGNESGASGEVEVVAAPAF